MAPKFLGRFLIAAVACCLLEGCRSDFHVVIYNDTNDPVILRRRTLDRFPVVVYAELSGEITGVSTDDFTVERTGKTLHYRFPAAYAFPSASIPAGFERNVAQIGRSLYLQLAPDDRIYLLRRREVLDAAVHSSQPPGFPLIPR